MVHSFSLLSSLPACKPTTLSAILCVAPAFAARGLSATLLCVLSCSKAVKTWIAEHNAQEAVIVGGGFIGIEMVENLVHLGLKVTLVEMLPQVNSKQQTPCLAAFTGIVR